MTDRVVPRALALIDRCRSIDWRRPRHNPVRAADAYERWLAMLGLRGYVEWVADPADVPAWHADAPGMVNAWGCLAATNPAGASVMGLLRGGPAAGLASSLASNVANSLEPAEPSTDTQIAANWAYAINVHVAAVEGAPEVWSGAWAELAARQPALALALTLLSPLMLWPSPAPATVVRAAPEALAACMDEGAWEAFATTAAGAPGGARAAPSAGMPTRIEMIDALATVAEPMVAACEAGAFAHALLPRKVVVLAAPSIWTDGGRLHRPDGPAIAWPRTRAGAWKGFLLPEGFVVAPDVITPDAIRAVTGRLQDALIDIYAHARGPRRCLDDIGGVVEHEDDTGRLWRVRLAQRHPSSAPRDNEPGDVKMVEVTSGTCRPDGARSVRWLRVPPGMRTAREAVTWACGRPPAECDGLALGA